MGAAFLEGGFQTPALHKIPHNLVSRLGLVGGKEGFGRSLSCRIAGEDPRPRSNVRGSAVGPGVDAIAGGQASKVVSAACAASLDWPVVPTTGRWDCNAGLAGGSWPAICGRSVGGSHVLDATSRYERPDGEQWCNASCAIQRLPGAKTNPISPFPISQRQLVLGLRSKGFAKRHVTSQSPATIRLASFTDDRWHS